MTVKRKVRRLNNELIRLRAHIRTLETEFSAEIDRRRLHNQQTLAKVDNLIGKFANISVARLDDGTPTYRMSLYFTSRVLRHPRTGTLDEWERWAISESIKRACMKAIDEIQLYTIRRCDDEPV